MYSYVANYIPANLMPYSSLLSFQIAGGEGGKYTARFQEGQELDKKWLFFDDWWNEIVIEDKRNYFSRKDIILQVANKDVSKLFIQAK